MGEILAKPGDYAGTALATECYKPTSNYIKIIKVLRDKRDGQIYDLVHINGVTWMAENLNYAAPNSRWYNDDPVIGETYGRLYPWNAAKKVCPDGWRLPTNEEWTNLAMKAGGYKYLDFGEWKNAGDPYLGYANLIEGGESGFNALLGGEGSGKSGKFSKLDKTGKYWTGNAVNETSTTVR